MNVLPPHSLVDWVMSNPLFVLMALIGLGLMLVGVTGLFKQRDGGQALAQAGAMRLGTWTDRWQLLTLGTTGIVLSLASGYTTWAGMTNFTGEAMLSLMITFGIQGVMLIVAWLIGESFAAGMNRQAVHGSQARGDWDPLIGMVLAVALISIVFYLVLLNAGAISWSPAGLLRKIDWSILAGTTAYFLLALIVVGVLAFNFSRRGDLTVPYVQSSRVIVRNAVLWVMFLACMATSVFFSFDALFSVIFPKSERVRAAELRAQNQVAGLIADIGTTIESRRLEEIDRLFQSEGWQGYNDNLARLTVAATQAQDALEAFFTKQIEDNNRAIKRQQERIASSLSSSAGLQSKKTVLTDELSRLKSERPNLAADLAAKKSELEARARGVDAKRVEMQAELEGAEGTLKRGRGPVYRQRRQELRQLTAAYEIQQRRVKSAQQRLGQVDRRMTSLEAQLAATDGELAKLKGEAETARQRINLRRDAQPSDDAPQVDPTQVLPLFETARARFRQEPTADRLGRLQQLCAQLYTAMASDEPTKASVRNVSCDPQSANEAAAVLFALNNGIKVFETGCYGGDKIAQAKGTDALYAFARKCLADSGLPSQETNALRAKINLAELSRDDKAHPFVATINAFQDGNRLAYLALGIAIAMDALVFMSGLFGANALRSPLSDVPTAKARSARQLEAIIDAALLPHTYEAAEHVVDAMRPMTRHDGFTARVHVSDEHPHSRQIRRVLNAGSTIGAVRHVDGHDHLYEIREELLEYLNQVKKKAFQADQELGRLAELQKVLTVALQPHVGDHADIVLYHCRPISERKGFSAEIYLSQMDANDRFIVQKALNAGGTLNYVSYDDRRDQQPYMRYYMHKQLYKTLLTISALYPKTGNRSTAPALAAPDRSEKALAGGDLTPRAGAAAVAGSVSSARPDAAIESGEEAFLLQDDLPSPSTMGEPDMRNWSSKQYQEYFIALFVEALGVDPKNYVKIADETLRAAQAAVAAFHQSVQQTNKALANAIEEREQEVHASIERTYAHIAGWEEAQTETAENALQLAHADVLGNLKLISLLPDGPTDRLIQEMVADMESSHGQGALPPEQQALFRLIKRLSDNLARSPRDDAEAWHRVKIGLPLVMEPEQPDAAARTDGSGRRSLG